jgi:hypothetical protein
MAAPVIPPLPPGFKLDDAPPLPPGFTLDSPSGAAPAAPAAVRPEDTIPGTPEEAAAFAAAPPPAAVPEKSFWDSIGETRILPDFDLHDLLTVAKGAPETALAAANNAVGMAGAGLGAVFAHPTDANAAANSVREFQPYQPKGESAQKLGAALGDAFAPYETGKEKLGDTVLEATGSPAAATGAHILPDLAGALLGAPEATATLPKVGEALAPVVKETRAAPKVTPETPPVETARAAGYDLLPSDVQRVTLQKPSLRERAAEAIAPTDVRRDQTIKNQGTTDATVARELGVPEGTRFNDATFEQLDAPHVQTYRDAEAAATVVPISPEFRQALTEAQALLPKKKGVELGITDTISALRRSAAKKMQSDDALIEKQGYALDDAADAVEEAFGKRLEELGSPEMLQKYRDARQALAKNNDVRVSLRGEHVDAGKLAKRDQKFPGRMTGGLKVVADVAKNFGDSTQSSLSGAGRAGASHLPESRTGIVTKLGKAAARGAAKLTGLGDSLMVDSPAFQNKIAPEASAERKSYFADYGRKPATAGAPVSAEPTGPGKEAIDFEPSAVQPANRLGEDLTLDGPQPEGIDIRTGTVNAPTEEELTRALLADRPMEQGKFTFNGEQPNQAVLTPSGGTITVGKGPRGTLTVRHEGGGEVTAVDRPDQNVVQITGAQVPKEMRSQGHYVSMVKRLISEAKKLGREAVYSDNRVSEPAQRAWASLEKSGVKVKRNPATKQANGELISKSDLKPVFEVQIEPDLGDALTR